MNDNCFICNKIIDNQNKADEHIFDDKLLKHLGLRKKSMLMPNSDFKIYGHSKVPCCKLCNIKLKSIANEVIESALSGYERILKIDKWKIYTWLLKIYLGLNIQDSRHKLDKKNPNSPKIADSNQLKRLILIRKLLYENIYDFKHSDFASIFYYKCMSNKEILTSRFNFFTSADTPFIAIKIDEIFLVAFLQDFGLVSNLDFMNLNFKNASKKYNQNYCTHPYSYPSIAKKINLHPAQVVELAAFFRAFSDLIYPIQISIYDNGNFSYKYIGKPEFPGAPPIRGWESDRFTVVRSSFFGDIEGQFLKSDGGTDYSLMVTKNNLPLQISDINDLPC